MAGTMDITVACGHLYAYDENLKSQKIPFVTETHDGLSILHFLLDRQLTVIDDQQPRPITSIQSDETVIELLIKENQDVWDMLLKNKFCQTGYDSTGEEFNTIFQGYAKVYLLNNLSLYNQAHDSNCIDNAKQDYRYLIEYVRFLTFRFLQDPSSHTEAGWKEILRTDEEAHGTIPKAVHGVGSYYECCIAMKINAEDLLKEKNSPPVLGYVAWEQLSAMTDDVFSNYVRMIPCIFVDKCKVRCVRLPKADVKNRAGTRSRQS